MRQDLVDPDPRELADEILFGAEVHDAVVLGPSLVAVPVRILFRVGVDEDGLLGSLH